jgi:hypothetical protein
MHLGLVHLLLRDFQASFCEALGYLPFSYDKYTAIPALGNTEFIAICYIKFQRWQFEIIFSPVFPNSRAN